MSDPAATNEDVHAENSDTEGDAVTAVAEPPTPEPLFNEQELSQFDSDDVEAGSAICKMLSLFFLYTVLAMAIVGMWTFANAFGE